MSVIRRAASVVVRRGMGDPRVFLARRSPQLRFFGDYYAFVGGGVGPEDDRDAERFAANGSTAFAVAAARELLEELGLDLSTAPLTGAAADEARRVLLAEEVEFLELPRPAHARIALEMLRPIVRLLTPAYHSIRFDTQFFLLDWEEAGLPEPTIWPGELAEGTWREPGQWLDLWRRGELLIAPPVLLILQLADRHGWSEGLEELLQLGEELGGGCIHTIFHNPAAQLLPVRTPTIPPATHTNVYLVGTDPAYLVDPATPYPDEQERLELALERSWAAGLVPERKLRAILLTHQHPDHVGAVERLRRRFEVPVWAHAATAAALEGEIAVDRLLEDGDLLPLGNSPDGRPDWRLEVLFTPGHAAGHLCFWEGRYGSLIAGDMISTLSSILVRRSDGDMATYMTSLERISALPARVVYPGHGPASSAGAAVLAAQLEHRKVREVAILAAIEGGHQELDAIVRTVYTDVPESMYRYAGQSVESVCVKLAQEGRVRMSGVRIEPA